MTIAIAVVGMSLKFPQDATTPEAFWKMLLEGRNASTEVPADRFSIDAFHHPDPARMDSIRVRKAHFLKQDIGAFDAPFFNMSAAEAACLDPQQRGLLQNTYHALENAGIRMSEIAGSDTSVYSASFSREYDSLFSKNGQQMSSYLATGLGTSMLANRISHFFDLRGPSLTVDTACSSGLYAVYLACQNLINGESSLSIVSGSNIYLGPDGMTQALSSAGFLSDDGRCFSFDSRANGYARGEGYGTMILKPLDLAIRDGNTIRAIVRGIGANQDGRTPSITQPSARAQVALIHDTYRRAGLSLAQTGMVEAHGTGTLVGDPIEANAIGEAFQDERRKETPLYIGAVKSNIGHLEGASGIAGFIKAVLVLENGIIPPNAEFQEINPAIEVNKYNIQIPSQPLIWPSAGLRRVSVNSFGYGGSNAHAILDDALSYLGERGLEGNHRTLAVPVLDCVAKSHEDDERGLSHANEHEDGRADLKGASLANGHSRPISVKIEAPTEAISPGVTYPTDLAGSDLHDERESHNVDADSRSAGCVSRHTLSPGPNSLERAHDVSVEGLEADAVEESSSANRQVHDATSSVKINGRAAIAENGHLSHGKRNDNSDAATHVVEDSKAAFRDDRSSGLPENADTKLKKPFVLVISSADEAGVQRQAIALQQHLLDLSPSLQTFDHLSDMAYTMANTRNLLRWRSTIVARTHEDLIVNLASNVPDAVRTSADAQLQFVFTGQGSQAIGMGMSLLKYEPFRKSIEYCDDYFRSLGCTWTLVDEVQKPKCSSRLNTPALSQPLCTSLQIALVDLLRAWHIYPKSVCGHSSGEIAAAYCAGHISRDYALKAAFFRGLVSEKIAGDHEREHTSMLSVGLDKDAAQALINVHGYHDCVVVACVNSPVNVTLSGRKTALDALWVALDDQKKFVRKLDINIAYHSSLMKEVVDEYAALLGSDKQVAVNGSLTPPEPTIMVSSINGKQISRNDVNNASYWCSNLVSPVSFSDAVNCMAQQARTETSALDGRSNVIIFMEIGPQSGLRRPVQDTLSARSGKGKWLYLPSLKAGSHADVALLEAAGALWAQGCAVNMALINASPEHRVPRIVLDLPSYSFNHTKKYWMESLASRQFRFRKHRRHSLLGVRSMEWNDMEASWRHVIRAQENKWALDHALNGSAIYPGSGMLVMAIEAIRQLSDAPQSITGFQLKNVRFLRAINVDKTERGVETRINLRPRRDATNSSRSWHDWRIFALNQESWIEAAYGSVKADYDYEENDHHATRQAEAVVRLREQSRVAKSHCAHIVSSQQFYDNLAEMGFHYGPAFSQLSSISFDKKGHASGQIPVRKWAMGYKFADWDPCVIHPTTLDTLFHLPAVDLSHGGWKKVPTMMFTHLGHLWVSQKLLSADDNAMLDAHASCTLKGFREAEHSIVAFSGETEGLMIRANKIRCTSITHLKALSHTEEASNRLCYRMRMLPSLDLFSKSQSQQYFDRRFASLQPPSKTSIDEADAVAMHYMSMVLAEIDQSSHTDFPGHLQKYVAWMRRSVEHMTELITEPMSDVDFESTLENPDDLAKELLHKVGRNLLDILLRDKNPVQLIFEDNLVQRFYRSPLFVSVGRKIASIVDHLAHANPDIKILEVGAGTGAVSDCVLNALTDKVSETVEIIRFGEYAYTDLSTAFFEHARERHPTLEQHMKFSKLDLEQDPITQGIKADHYDIVIAASVLHATQDLRATLRNLRSILKTGGCLLASESCNVDTVRDNFIFGTLPGWWLAQESERAEGPLLAEYQWDALLKECGFSGIDQRWRDYEEKPYHRLTVFMSTAVDLPVKNGQHSGADADYCILLDSRSSLQNSLAQSLQVELAEQQPQIITMADAARSNLVGSFIVSLLEVDTHVWADITPTTWDALQGLIVKAKKVVWVTSSVSQQHSQPESEIITGLSRSICTERAEPALVTLQLSKVESLEAAASHIGYVAKLAMEQHGNWHDSEFTEINGVLNICRLVPFADLNQSVGSRVQQDVQLDYTFGQSESKDLTMTIGLPGVLETLHFAENVNSFPDLEPDDIEIRIAKACLNFKDCMIALGQVVGNGLGFDGSGTVCRSSSSKLKIGDRVVFGTSRGAFGSFVRVKATHAQRIPDSMDFAVAAAIPIAYSTALYALKYIARAQKGESILIHSAAGGVGQAAVMLAQSWGLDVYVTTSLQAKREQLTKDYGIPEDRIFSSRDITFASDIKMATDGRGVDIVLNSLGGDLLQASWECIATMGRFVEIGKRDIIMNNTLAMGPFDRNCSFCSVDLTVIMEHHPAILEKLLQESIELVAQSDSLHEPRPLTIYNADKIEEAMHYMQSGKSTGRIIIDFATDTTVKYLPCPKPSYMFTRDATYVIAGGLGGLGRSIVTWMTSRGARHFLLLSRRGSAGNHLATNFIDEVQAEGARIWAPACDITDRPSLEVVLRQCSESMPPIRGCIQGAMVLHDVEFKNMTHTNFEQVLSPKVRGSWNLHDLLPTGLDFFVLLSSFTGVSGNFSQANYAAGNTFQDALARYRVSIGENAVCLDLPMLLEVGWAAENYGFIQMLRRAGISGLRQDQFIALLDAVCDPAYDCKAAMSAQIITMPDTPQSLYTKYIESPISWTNKALFKNLRRLGMTFGKGDGKSANPDTVDYLALVKAAPDVEEATQVIVQGLIKKLAKSLSVPEDDIEPSKAPYMLGVDSLAAVEVRYWFMKEVQVEVAVFNILKDQSIMELCRDIASQARGEAESTNESKDKGEDEAIDEA